MSGDLLILIGCVIAWPLACAMERIERRMLETFHRARRNYGRNE